MMRRTCLLLLGLAFVQGCRRPEVEAFRIKPAPIAVAFQVPSDVPGARELGEEYAAVLRAQLAQCVEVVPEGVALPAPVCELRVEILDVRPPSRTSPAAVGVGTGVAVGALSTLAGNRGGWFDGLFWGLWAGHGSAQVQREEDGRLGFRPVKVDARVRMTLNGVSKPLFEFPVRGREVVDRMAPVVGSDGARIREAEAKAFANVVVARICERFDWMPLAEPRYYRVPEPQVR